MNYKEYSEFCDQIEVTPMHFSTDTVECDDIIKFNRLHHAVMGMSGEAGEVSEHIKKSLYGKRKPFTSEVEAKVFDECSDVFFYLGRALKAQGRTLEELMEHNYNKLTTRYKDFLEYKEMCSTGVSQAEIGVLSNASIMESFKARGGVI